MKRLLILVLMIAALPAARAGAWSTDGHRQVCAAAWIELNAAAAARLGALLKVASADEFAALCRHDAIGPADLMSLPSGAGSLDLDRDCAPARSCPVREIERAIEALRASASASDAADVVLRLAHFTAEVHQPLSVGYGADRNGLGISATFLGRPTNMHAIWNEGLLAAPAPPRGQDIGFDLRESPTSWSVRVG